MTTAKVCWQTEIWFFAAIQFWGNKYHSLNFHARHISEIHWGMQLFLHQRGKVNPQFGFCLTFIIWFSKGQHMTYWVGTSLAKQLGFKSLSCAANWQRTIYSFHGQQEATRKAEERSAILTSLAQSPSLEWTSFLFCSTYMIVLGLTSALITQRGSCQRNELNVNRPSQQQKSEKATNVSNLRILWGILFMWNIYILFWKLLCVSGSGQTTAGS